MKQIKYFCNLCGEEHKKADLLCMYWDSSKIVFKNNEKMFGGYIFNTNVDSADKHVCKVCFKITFDFVNENKQLFNL